MAQVEQRKIGKAGRVAQIVRCVEEPQREAPVDEAGRAPEGHRRLILTSGCDHLARAKMQRESKGAPKTQVAELSRQNPP